MHISTCNTADEGCRHAETFDANIRPGLPECGWVINLWQRIQHTVSARPGRSRRLPRAAGRGQAQEGASISLRPRHASVWEAWPARLCRPTGPCRPTQMTSRKLDNCDLSVFRSHWLSVVLMRSIFHRQYQITMENRTVNFFHCGEHGGGMAMLACTKRIERFCNSQTDFAPDRQCTQKACVLQVIGVQMGSWTAATTWPFEFKRLPIFTSEKFVFQSGGHDNFC